VYTAQCKHFQQGRLRTIPFTDARANFKRVIDQVVDDVDVILTTRRNTPDAVAMSQEHYDSLMETVHLLQSPANIEYLERSIAHLMWTAEARGDYIYWQATIGGPSTQQPGHQGCPAHTVRGHRKARGFEGQPCGILVASYRRHGSARPRDYWCADQSFRAATHY
jgi:antitoxin YefM